MAYALIENEQVVKYPLSIEDINEISLTIGFELDTIEKKAAAGILAVYKSEVNRKWDKNYILGTPVLVGDSWFESWQEISKPQEEIEILVTNKWNKVRKERNQLLGESDWTQLPDCPLTTEKVSEWAVYRQQLRDITESPDPFAISFPPAPSE